MLQKIKVYVRNIIDSFYCRNIPSKKRIGDVDSWSILTDKLHSSVVFSGGVGKDITFEIKLANQYGCRVYLYDPSPTGINTVQKLLLPEKIKFSPVGLAGNNGEVVFSKPKNILEGSYTISDEGDTTFSCRKLSELIAENCFNEIELVKIDIEGFEYQVLEELLDSNIMVRQIVVEYHHFFKSISSTKTSDSIKLLKSKGYILFHKSGHDYSFVRKNSLPIAD